MNITFPVSKKDIHLAPILISTIEALGGCKGHNALVATPSHLISSEEITSMVKGLQPLFDSVKLVELTGNIEKILPTNLQFPHFPPANAMFSTFVRWNYKENNKRPFYWFELDNTPLVENWVDILEKEYNQALQLGKKHAGAFAKLFTYYPDGRVEPANSSFMIGTSIWSGDLPEHSQIFHQVVYEAFDIAIRYEVSKYCYDMSHLIAHKWGTKNYRMEGGKLLYDVDDRNKALASASSKIVVLDDLAVLHGCKDGSLAKLIALKKK